MQTASELPFVQFHCTKKVRRSAKKSKHSVLEQCDVVKKVLALDPERGLVIPRHSTLRKMRVGIPQSGMGKSGGYRLIYRQIVVEQEIYIILLAIYFKGDQEDLKESEYLALHSESEGILDDLLAHEWEGS
jgi:hypothetical protein